MPKLLILYGSETGNAQDLAKCVGWQAKKRSLNVIIKSCDDYPFQQLVDHELIMFICSTTGQGDEPRNMQKFWRFIRRKNLPSDSLKNVRVSVIGLGDSSYQKYNFVAKRLHKRLLDLGAQIFMPLVLGDDQHDLGFNASKRHTIKNNFKP